MNLPQKKVDFVSLKGGIDLASTVLEVYQGAAISLLNFEPKLGGGYKRILGYERGDGRQAPSDTQYYVATVDDASGLTVGDTLTGVTSSATAKIYKIEGNTLGLIDIVGTFVADETVNGVNLDTIPVVSGITGVTEDEQWELDAHNYRRSTIGAVPGTGNVLGAFAYGSLWYAFRVTSGAVRLYKSSASGWTHVPYFHLLYFDAGVMSEGEIAAGTSITGASSSAAGTVKRFIKNDGGYGADASGYMVVDISSGAFVDNEDIQVGGVTKAVANGASAAITMAPGGRFEFINHNFYGGSATRYVYGADGVNPAFEFDGTTLVPIMFPEGNPSFNKPKYITAFKSHLWFSYPGGRVAHSAIGEPLVMSALLGAAEFGLGDECTGMAQRSGDVLAIYTRRRTYAIYGYSALDWAMKIISEAFGAKDYTVQVVGTVYALEDKGIAPLERVDAYGDFENATVSRLVKPILDKYKNSLIGSVVVKESNQYRLFFNDGSGLIMNDDAYTEQTLPAFSTFQFPDIPTCLSNMENASGNEVILFGDKDGFVYQMERGYNFDGDAIEWAYRTPFMAQKSPHLRKSYSSLFVDIEAQQSFPVSISTDLSFSEIYTASNNSDQMNFAGGGGFWDTAFWDDFFWDAEIFSSRGITLSGTGKNISVLFYGNSDRIRPFTIQTLEIHYIPRRLKRGK
jgi:hypothetical protein